MNMNADEILKLIDAGFTADEIRKMSPAAASDPKPETDPAPAPTPSPAPEQAAPEQPVVPEQKPEPAPNPGPDPLDSIRQQIAGLTTVVEKMSKSIIMPTMDDVQPLGVEDIISKFFKED